MICQLSPFQVEHNGNAFNVQPLFVLHVGWQQALFIFICQLLLGIDTRRTEFAAGHNK